MGTTVGFVDGTIEEDGTVVGVCKLLGMEDGFDDGSSDGNGSPTSNTIA